MQEKSFQECVEEFKHELRELGKSFFDVIHPKWKSILLFYILFYILLIIAELIGAFD